MLGQAIFFGAFAAWMAWMIVQALKSGEANNRYLDFQRSENPAGFWFVVGFYIVMGGCALFAAIMSVANSN